MENAMLVASYAGVRHKPAEEYLIKRNKFNCKGRVPLANAPKPGLALCSNRLKLLREWGDPAPRSLKTEHLLIKRFMSSKSEPVRLDIKFKKLADEWSGETMHISSASDLISDKRYREIIGLGWDVVPYLLADLRDNKRFWFPALAEITGVRPFDQSDLSNPRRMTEAWLRWGKLKGLI